jgi:outer membrane biosynthesis protein TonB
MSHSFNSLDELLHTVRRTENPNADDRRAVRRGLSALFATAVTTSTAVASAAAKPALLSSFLWPFVTGALLGGAVIVTSAVASHPQMFGVGTPSNAAGAVRPGAAPLVAPSELSPPGEMPSAVPAPQSEPRVPEPQPTPEVREPEPRTPAPPQTPAPANVPVAEPASVEPRSPQSLEAESRALAEAQRALRDNDAEWALSMLAAQDRTFSGGVLGEERAAARVLATCAAGRLDEGRAAAERFQKQYPGSLLTERVRQACEP